jgi:hypothetical protein
VNTVCTFDGLARAQCAEAPFAEGCAMKVGGLYCAAVQDVQILIMSRTIYSVTLQYSYTMHQRCRCLQVTMKVSGLPCSACR